MKAGVMALSLSQITRFNNANKEKLLWME